MERLPVGFVQTERPQDPAGVCDSCRFFVGSREAPAEFAAELRFLGGSTGVTLKTSERLRDAEGYEQYGEAVAKTTIHYDDMWGALLHRINMEPENFGMCEKGGPFGYPGATPAALLHRYSGLTADEYGRRLDQCSRWQRKWLPHQIAALLNLGRPVDWRERRERALAMRRNAVPRVFEQECPWHKGRLFLNCCGKEG